MSLLTSINSNLYFGNTRRQRLQTFETIRTIDPESDFFGRLDPTEKRIVTALKEYPQVTTGRELATHVALHESYVSRLLKDVHNRLNPPQPAPQEVSVPQNGCLYPTMEVLSRQARYIVQKTKAGK